MCSTPRSVNRRRHDGATALHTRVAAESWLAGATADGAKVRVYAPPADVAVWVALARSIAAVPARAVANLTTGRRDAVAVEAHAARAGSPVDARDTAAGAVADTLGAERSTRVVQRLAARGDTQHARAITTGSAVGVDVAFDRRAGRGRARGERGDGERVDRRGPRANGRHATLPPGPHDPRRGR